MTSPKDSSAPVALICHTIVTVALIAAYAVTGDPQTLVYAGLWNGAAGVQKAIGR
jgi:hypothetical protein